MDQLKQNVLSACKATRGMMPILVVVPDAVTKARALELKRGCRGAALVEILTDAEAIEAAIATQETIDAADAIMRRRA